MAVLGWCVVLPVCEKPRRDLPSDTRLHRLLVSLLDIQTQVEPPLHACLQEHLRVTTLRRLQPVGTEGPTKQVQPQHAAASIFSCVHVPVCLAVFFVRRPRSACHVERTVSLMGHIQTKDRLHMGNNTLRHLAMMYVNKPTTDNLDGESD